MACSWSTVVYFWLLATVLALPEGNGQEITNYAGYQVVRVETATPEAYEQIRKIHSTGKFDFWNEPRENSFADIMTPPHFADALKTSLASSGIPHSVVIENVQTAIDAEKIEEIGIASNKMDWKRYHRIETIHQWIDTMADENPSLVTAFTYGKSSEGRDMKGLKISTAPNGVQRLAIWIDGGIHAREWISPATVSYMANELVVQANSGVVQQLLQIFDFYIVPSLNPDGYAHTMAPITGNRMWRKTRSSPKEKNIDNWFGLCKGVDPNRNWDYKWGGKGTSDKPCDNTYRGEKPASEPEVSSTQNFILSIKDRLKLFWTVHSYSQILLLPWSYDKVRADDHEQLMKVGNRSLEALEKPYGTKYTIGNTAEILYPAAGGSFDWAKAVAGVAYSYGWELRDKGRYGFLLPANQIIPSGIETFEALKTMAMDIATIYAPGRA